MIKDLFLQLTQYTIPFKYEDTLQPILKQFGLEKDSIGNYYIKIGESETLFTTHLDTYCKKYEKVNHIIEGNIIKTDETTILGGDNKLGCSILLYMIQNNVPGTYYFFLGEEPILSGGLYGSKNALAKYPNLFKQFKRAIAFDRKQMGSIVTRQMARNCCSPEFVEALSKQFAANGMEYKADQKAYYTDTATFLDTIPECTNISAGGWNEHYVTEWVDIGYTQKVAEAAIRINWEALPTNRPIDNVSDVKVVKFKNKIPKKIADAIFDLMDKYDHLNTNINKFNSGNVEYLEFNRWFEDTNILFKYSDNILSMRHDDKDWIKINSLKQADLILSNIFGVQFDEDQNDIYIDIDNNAIFVLEEEFSIDGYIKYFNNLNKTDNTSYKLEGIDDQYQDISGMELNKSQFLAYLKNLLIN